MSTSTAMFHDAELYEKAYDQAVRNNEEALAAIDEFKKEVEGVKETLEENQKHLFQPIMAPLAGGKALMRAKLIHTNEVMVFLGDKWFLRTSSARAIDICNRKIARCNENKADIELQTERFSLNREKIQEYELFSGTDIVEPYDAEAEKLWKEKHREKVREFKKQEAAERNKYNDEEIFKKLNSMEVIENSKSNETDEETNSNSSDEGSIAEITDAEIQSSNSNRSSSNLTNTSQYLADRQDETPNDISNVIPQSVQSLNSSFSAEESNLNPLKLHTSNFSSIGNTHVSPSAFEGADISFENTNGTGHSDSENTTQNQSVPKKRVSFSAADEFKCYLPLESDDDTNIIRFKHSDVKPLPVTHKTDRIESPSDIYQLISQGFNPKSILKKGTRVFPEDMPRPTETGREWKTRFDTTYPGYYSPENHEEVVFGDISEKNPVSVLKVDTSSRKPSQFRKARNKHNNQ